jgi:phosphatidylserine decarboxylase
VAQIEVGAMLVGKIRNFQSGEAMAVRGERKGMFLYGGSTVILLMQKDKVKLRDEFFDNTEKGIETPVRYGESIGVSLT